MCLDVLRKRRRGKHAAFLRRKAERDIPWDPEPGGRYNVAPGTKVLLLSERKCATPTSIPFTGAMRRDGGINHR